MSKRKTFTTHSADLITVLDKCRTVIKKNSDSVRDNCVKISTDGSGLCEFSVQEENTLYFRESIAIFSQDAEELEFHLNLREMQQALKGVKKKEAIAIEVDDSFLYVNNKQIALQKLTAPFENIHHPSSNILFEVSGKELKHLIDRVAYAASTDTTRAGLDCVSFKREGDVLQVVSTTGFVLSCYNTTEVKFHNIEFCFMASAKVLAQSMKLIDDKSTVFVARTESSISFNGATYDIDIPCPVYQYPNYDSILSQVSPRKATISIPANVLRAAISDYRKTYNPRGVAAIDRGVHGIDFLLFWNKFHVRGNSDEVTFMRYISDTLCAENMTIMLNNHYLYVAMMKRDEEDETLELVALGETLPIYLLGGGHTQVIMPIHKWYIE